MPRLLYQRSYSVHFVTPILHPTTSSKLTCFTMDLLESAAQGANFESDNDPLVPRESKLAKTDDTFKMALLTAQLLAGMSSRLRALESAVYYSYLGRSDDILVQ